MKKLVTAVKIIKKIQYHEYLSKIWTFIKLGAGPMLTTINLILLSKYHNIFTFNLKFWPESFVVKIMIFINWLFGFAFLPGCIYLVYFWNKKLYSSFIATLLICIAFDVVAWNHYGAIGYCINYYAHFSISIVICLTILGLSTILLIKKPKYAPKKEKRIRIANTQLIANLPSLQLLSIGPKISITFNVENQKKILMKTLQDFGIKAELVDVVCGPVVSLYAVELAPGIKSSRLINLADDIARSMQTFSARIATIPGKNLIGIEISNEKRQIVYFKDGLQSTKYNNFDGSLPLYLGSNIHGEHEVFDLSAMPHLLVAGTTGSGKSVGIHTMLLSMLFKRTPTEMKLILIDPKKLELTPYEEIPHLLLPVVTEAKQAVSALKWSVIEMENRYRRISKLGVRNILTYNAKLEQTNAHEDKLPFIVIVVDELADLMLLAGKEIEICVQRLAQMGRAAGIHIIVATQRPSVDVITGTIKANFPTRISFKLSTKIDSRTILGDMSGAEQLLGAGDMLYLSTNGKLNRIHGSFVSEEDVVAVVEFWRKQGTPEYIELPEENTETGSTSSSNFETEPYYQEAIGLFKSTQKISASFLQRNFPIGYNRAAKIIEQMEKDGIISSGDKFGRNRELL